VTAQLEVDAKVLQNFSTWPIKILSLTHF